MTTRARTRPTGRVTPRTPRQPKEPPAEGGPQLPRSVDEAEQEIVQLTGQINATVQQINNQQQAILAGQQRISYLQGFVDARKNLK